ncbi:thioredoxin [Comamonas testosteroni]|uniref:Thioredoxin n=1 Tax=Comamonas testosteroni TaxID=285 RepID=A0A373FKZ3_COMTE|nr:thioredoxin family protein [Comamonas testosteroni]RGE44135.1 thioredoxin [Comamonas testosteroni]
MPYQATHWATEPTRQAINALKGANLLEFGTPWCGHCQRAQPLLQAALAAVPELPHIKVEDGPGKPLGRSYRVKLWPTLIFLRDGQEVARLVRPENEQQIAEALALIAP